MHAKVVPSSTFQLQQRSGEELTEANTQAVTKTPHKAEDHWFVKTISVVIP